MSAPTNISAGTAITIPSLPYTNTQSVVVSGAGMSVWYRYVCQYPNEVLSVFAFGDLSVYGAKPLIQNAALDKITTGIANLPIEVPLGGSGSVYYIEVVPDPPSPVSGTLTLNVQRISGISTVGIPVGYVAIPGDGQTDDTPPRSYPLAFLNPSADGLVGFLAPGFPVGEYGVTMADGTIMMSTDDDDLGLNQVKILDASLTLQHTFTFGPRTSALQFSGMTTEGTTFYVSYIDGSAIVQAIAKNGTTGTLYSITDVYRVAVSPDNLILYYTKKGDTTIHRWDLVNNTGLSDLVAGSAHDQVGDLLCLQDGSVVIGDVTSTVLHRYSVAGALLNTYTPPVTPLSVLDRLWPSSDATSFWGYLHGDGTIPLHVVQIKASDGTVLTNTSYYTYSGSIGGNNDGQFSPTATPPARFGPSSSCPGWLTRVSLPNTAWSAAGASGSLLPAFVGTRQTVPIRRVRRTPQMTSELLFQFMSRFEIMFQPGAGIPSDLTTPPKFMIRWSKDGGNTWSQEVQMSAGMTGAYWSRVFVTRGPRARNVVFEVSTSDAALWVLVDAFIQSELGSS